jgi:hypothetical protein
LSEEPLARLEASSISPRYTRHGPFRVPAPGLAIEAPTFSLHDQPCTPEDWARILRDLATWRGLPGADKFLLNLPDGRVLAFLRPPSLGERHLSGIVRPLAPTASSPGTPARPGSFLLRITHDGDTRLLIDLRPASSRPSRPASPTEIHDDQEITPPTPDTSPDALPASSTPDSPSPASLPPSL